MAQIYRMPAVSPTMETGTIAAWRLTVGQKFASGAVVADVGTDKATMEAEIFDDGFLLALLVPEGAEVKPGAPIAIWSEKADDDFAALAAEAKAELAAGSAAVQAPPPAAPAETAAPAATSAPVPPPALAAPVTKPEPRAWMGKRLAAHFGDPPGDLRVGATGSDARVRATPLARSLAAERGVDLRRVRGTGPSGRVVRADVEAAPTTQGAAAAPAPSDTTLPLTPMRKTIAKRLLASHQDIPTFFLTVTLDGSAFVALREAVKVAMPDVNVSYNDMLLAAVARALREVPEANASWTDAGIVRHGRVDLGVAVAIPDGLITPVVRDADRRKVSDIAATVRELAQRAKAGKLKPDEYTGSTFTISNLGMMGIDRFTAIINPPEAAILAVGRMAQVPVVVAGQLAVGWRFDVTMTCDHRVLDGAIGAKFLAALKRHVESPALALI